MTFQTGVSEGDYNAMPGVRASLLKAGIPPDGSLARMRLYSARPPKTTKALDTGTLLHAMVLEPDRASSLYAVWASGDKRGKEYNAFEAEHPGRIIIKPGEYDDLCRMRDSIHAHKHARALLVADAQRECVATWKAAHGFVGKCRADFYNAERRMIVDLKTAASVDDREWTRAAVRFGYDVQQVWYTAGMSRALGGVPVSMSFVVVSKDDYETRVFTLPPDFLQATAEAIKDLLGRWRAAVDSGVYPYPDRNDPTEVVIPGWAWRTNTEVTDDAGF